MNNEPTTIAEIASAYAPIAAQVLESLPSDAVFVIIEREMRTSPFGNLWAKGRELRTPNLRCIALPRSTVHAELAAAAARGIDVAPGAREFLEYPAPSGTHAFLILADGRASLSGVSLNPSTH